MFFQLFINERGLLIALLKLILCFTKKYELTNNKQNELANNFEIQVQLISGIFITLLFYYDNNKLFINNLNYSKNHFIIVLSDFYEVPLVKQHILQTFFFCIFNQYLTQFDEIPQVVMDKLYTPIKINKKQNSNDNLYNTMLFSSNYKIVLFSLILIQTLICLFFQKLKITKIVWMFCS